MAKKWIPSQKQLSIYDEVLKRSNQIRKGLLKIRRQVEEEGGSSSLPALVIPKKARRFKDLNQYQFDSFKAYRDAIKRAQYVAGKSIKDFINQHYRANILNHLRDWITQALSDTYQVNVLNLLGYNKETGQIEGLGVAHAFTKEQMAEIDNEKILEYMKLYNELARMDTSMFFTFYSKNYMPILKYIYTDLTSDTNLESNTLNLFEDGLRTLKQDIKAGRTEPVDIGEITHYTKLYKKALEKDKAKK